jgi:hypothetical protein
VVFSDAKSRSQTKMGRHSPVAGASHEEGDQLTKKAVAYPFTLNLDSIKAITNRGRHSTPGSSGASQPGHAASAGLSS